MDLKIEALRLAVQAYCADHSVNIVSLAKEIYDFIMSD